MAKSLSGRHIFVTQPGKLSCRNNQLVIRQVVDDDLETVEYTVPLEDIRSVIIENRQVVVTSSLLSNFAEYKIVAYTCDEKHTPNGVFLPFNQHSRGTKIMYTQLNMKRPLVKRLWQSIVKRKIENQAMCLSLADCKGWERLFEISKKVESGDRTFMESQAARQYFTLLFGKGFKRSSDALANSAMNYGYAIVRGQVARSLCAFGFQPSIGLQHHNELNGFNLADDLMEPYRPFVDLVVVSELDLEARTLTKAHRIRLYEILTQSILLETERFNATASIEAMVSSLSSSIMSEDSTLLRLPRLTDIEVGVIE